MSTEAKVSATKTKTDTPIEKEAIEASSPSCTFSECNLEPIIKEDALADLDEREWKLRVITVWTNLPSSMIL